MVCSEHAHAIYPGLSFRPSGFAPVGGVKKGEFRDWARVSSGIAELSSLISLNDLSEGGGGGGAAGEVDSHIKRSGDDTRGLA